MKLYEQLFLIFSCIHCRPIILFYWFTLSNLKGYLVLLQKRLLSFDEILKVYYGVLQASVHLHLHYKAEVYVYHSEVLQATLYREENMFRTEKNLI